MWARGQRREKSVEGRAFLRTARAGAGTSGGGTSRPSRRRWRGCAGARLERCSGTGVQAWGCSGSPHAADAVVGTPARRGSSYTMRRHDPVSDLPAPGARRAGANRLQGKASFPQRDCAARSERVCFRLPNRLTTHPGSAALKLSVAAARAAASLCASLGAAGASPAEPSSAPFPGWSEADTSRALLATLEETCQDNSSPRPYQASGRTRRSTAAHLAPAERAERRIRCRAALDDATHRVAPVCAHCMVPVAPRRSSPGE